MKKSFYTFLFLSLFAILASCQSEEKSHGAKDSHHHHDEEAGDEIELSQEQIDAVKIEIGELSSVNLGVTLKATGVLAVDAQNEGVAAPLSPGVVKKLMVKVGDHVNAGTVVAYMENLDAIPLQQDYLLAKEEVEAALQELRRQEALEKEGAGIGKNLQLARTNLQLANTRLAGIGEQLAARGISPSAVKAGHPVTQFSVVSPMAGVVTQVNVAVGGFADMQTPMVRIVNNNALYADINIFEKDVAEVKAGQPVELYLTNRPDAVMQGVVSSLTDVMDPATKAVSARVTITGGKTPSLIPGMAVTAVIVADETPSLALPDDAIVTAEGKSYVFAVEGTEKEDGKLMTHFRKMEVVCGTKERGFTAVKFIEQPPQGTRFVVKNAFYLGSMTSDHGEHNH